MSSINIGVGVIVVLAVLLIPYILFSYYRNRIFEKISKEYKLQCSIDRWPITRLIYPYEEVELRKLFGTIGETSVVIKDTVRLSPYLTFFSPWPLWALYLSSNTWPLVLRTHFVLNGVEQQRGGWMIHYSEIKSFCEKIATSI